MKICLYGYGIATRGSGARQYALDLGRWLVKQGSEVTIVTGQWGDRSAISEGLKYEFLVFNESPLKRRAQILFALKSVLYFRTHRRDFDLVHSLSSFPQFARLASWVKRTSGLPVVHSLLGPCEHRSFFDFLDGVTCVSKGIQEKVQMPHAIYIPPFIDLERFRSSSRYDWGHPDEVSVGTMGAPFRRKGVRYLVEAIPLVLRQYPKTHFYLAVDLPGIQFMEETRKEKEYIDWFVREHQLQKNVDILGDVEVPKFLKSVDLFVYAVQTTVGMIDIPPSILEGLAAGCAIVTSQKDGIGELVRDHHNGLFVNQGEHDRPQAYAEKMIELLQNRPLLKTIRENGPPSVERFALDRVGQQMVLFYQEVLEHRRMRNG
ncbi:MAG: glycosyltransferase family 4 protein [Thermodesulfobacteriota bacterium]